MNNNEQIKKEMSKQPVIKFGLRMMGDLIF